jgi:RIO-like serine/threonine protein kinase
MEALTEGLRGWSEEFPVLNDIASAIQELAIRGVYGIDFNPRNIAISNDGTPIIFDVGAVSFDRESWIRTVGCSGTTTLRIPR